MVNAVLLMAHLSATWYMTGLIWFVQIVHYPLMMRVGREGFVPYSIAHQSSTSLAVGPPMLIEIASAILLCVLYPDLRHSRWFILACGLLGIVWLSTAFVQVPAHRALLNGFNENQIQWLVRTNWIRTFAWTGRALIMGGLVLYRLKRS